MTARIRRKPAFPARLASAALLLAVAATTSFQALAATTLGVISDSHNQPPMVVTSANNPDLVYIAEKDGRIWVLDKSTSERKTFINLEDKVSKGGERGLLGLAFDPDFETNGHFYVNYTRKNTFETVIERYTIDPGDPKRASHSSAYQLMTVDQPAMQTAHKAGWIGFRPGEDSNLYIAMGDGAGSINGVPDPFGNGQNLQSNLGKILRIDVTRDDFGADPDRNYGVPADNLFATDATANPEIWAYGLRNPFRNSFDSQTGDFWIGDVGNQLFDEINFLENGTAAGTNLGWVIREGNTGPALAGATDPILNLPVDSGSALIGGMVYRGSIDELFGLYIYADFIRGTIGSFRYDSGTDTISEMTDRTAEWFDPFGFVMPTSFGTDLLGNLYLTDFNGRVFMLNEVSEVPLPPAFLLFSSGLAVFIRRRRKSVG